MQVFRISAFPPGLSVERAPPRGEGKGWRKACHPLRSAAAHQRRKSGGRYLAGGSRAPDRSVDSPKTLNSRPQKMIALYRIQTLEGSGECGVV